MATHPNQHVLKRHLGGKTETQADLRLRLADDESPEQSEANQGLRLEAGDTVLVCSDGLSDLVTKSAPCCGRRRRRPPPSV